MTLGSIVLVSLFHLWDPRGFVGNCLPLSFLIETTSETTWSDFGRFLVAPSDFSISS